MTRTTRLSSSAVLRPRRVAAAAASIGTAVVLTAAIAHASDYVSNPPTMDGGRHAMAAPSTSAPMTSRSVTISQAEPQDMSLPQSQPQSGGGMMPATVYAAARHGFSFRTIDDAADPTFNQLLGVNNRGRIVGYFGSGADAAHPNKGFIVRAPYSQNTFRNENFPGSVQTQVVGINNAGVTVGFYVDGAGANIGFVEHDGRFTSVANPATAAGAPFNQLLGVNDYGVAVGFFNDADGASHGYTFDTRDGSFTDVMLPVAADSVTATGIADDGTVSGFYVRNKVTFGFLVHGDHFQRLSFGGNTNTQALGINDGHQVVGSYVDGAGAMHGFLWSPTPGMTRVDEPNAAAGTVVNGLNNRGQLVGFYVDGAGNTHGFLARRSS